MFRINPSVTYQPQRPRLLSQRRTIPLLINTTNAGNKYIVKRYTEVIFSF